MARIYPTPIGPTESPAERRLYDLLRDQLGDQFVVFHDVSWLSKPGNRAPLDGQADFVIAHPELGVLVMEVKGGKILRDGSANVWTSIDRQGIPHDISDPFSQVRREMHCLQQVASEMPDWPSSAIRFVRAVAFPDAVYDRARTPDGPPATVIDREDLLRLEARVHEIFDWWSASGDAEAEGTPPGTRGIELLTDLLARSFTIESPLRMLVEEDDRALVALTDQQFALLDFLRYQRRALITGIAGSGKTMLAAEHARRLATQGMRVLVTCVDRPLADHLRATIGRLDRIDVTTFEQLTIRLLRDAGVEAGHKDENPQWWRDEMPELLMRAVVDVPHSYDAVVVDEAQDIQSVWWVPLFDLLRHPRDGIAYVFGDSNQDLYDIDDSAERGIVMLQELPHFEMNQNRRSSKTIHDFARRFYTLAEGSPEPRALGPPGRPIQVRTYPTVEQGDMPFGSTSAPARGCRDELRKVLHEIINRGHVRSSDVIVLTPRTIHSWLTGAGAPSRVGSFDLVPEMLPDGSSAPLPTHNSNVRVANIERFKGLEANVVVLAEIDGRISPNRLATTMYVGATRARTDLWVIADERRAALLHGPEQT